MDNTVTLESVLEQARRLSPGEQVRLIAKIAVGVEQALGERAEAKQPLRSLWGLCADLGQAPSAEEIDEARREAWANFPRDDI